MLGREGGWCIGRGVQFSHLWCTEVYVYHCTRWCILVARIELRFACVLGRKETLQRRLEMFIEELESLY